MLMNIFESVIICCSIVILICIAVLLVFLTIEAYKISFVEGKTNNNKIDKALEILEKK